MATPLAELGQNTEIDENSSGETIIRNTQTGTEIRLANFIDIAGPIGDSSDPVAGTSHFEGLEAGSVNTKQGPSAVRHAEAFPGADGGEKIQNAIDDLPAEGGTVIIGSNGPDSNSKWVVNSKINPKDNVTIQGVGQFSTRLKLADGADTQVFEISDLSHITFADLEIDGNRANQTNDSNTNHPQVIKGASDVSYATFRNLYIHHPTNSCINFEKGTPRHNHITIEDCVFDNDASTSESGFRPGEDCVEFKNTDYVTVTGCLFRRALKDCLEFEASKHCSATGNVFEDTSESTNGEAILVQSIGTGDGIAENITITGNTLNTSNNDGVNIAGGQDIIVADNILVDVANKGINVVSLNGVNPERIQIKDNDIYLNSYNAAAVKFINAQNDCLIGGNLIYGGDRSIFINKSSGVSVTDNRIRNAGRAGVYVNDGGGEHQVTDNRVASYAQDSIADAINIQDNDTDIEQNHVVYSTAKAYRVSGAACRVIGNTSTTDAGDSFRDSSFTTDTLVRDNDPQPGTSVFSASSPSIAWSDDIVLLDGQSNSVDASLPDPGAHPGAEVFVKTIDVTNSVTVSPNGTEDIDQSQSPITLSAGQDSYLLRSGGTFWWIVGGVGA